MAVQSSFTHAEQPTIQQLRKAFQDTPAPLRRIEEGWRARRRGISDSPGGAAYAYAQKRFVEKPRKSDSENATAPGEHGGHLRPPGNSLQEGQTRLRRGRQRKVDLPLSPPPTPPLPPKKYSASSARRLRIAGDVPQPMDSIPRHRGVLLSQPRQLTRHPQPLLASPLPPTFHPDSPIQVLPREGKYEFIIALPSSTVHVSSGGQSMQITPTVRRSPHPHNIKTAAKTGSGDAARAVAKAECESTCHPSRTIHLKGEAKWTKAERKEYDMVYVILQEYKRKTPTVKIFHELGDVLITCSSPPDVILTFRVESGGPPGKGHRTKVRVRYSRILKQVTTDVQDTVLDSYPAVRAERFRSKRILNLGEGSYAGVHDTKSSEGAPRGRRRGTSAGAGATSNSATEGDIQKAYLHLDILGLDNVALASWRHEEREGIIRLWRLQAEWGRYG